MGHKKRGRAAKKARLAQQTSSAATENARRNSMVIHKGDVGRSVRQLVRDVRRVLEPFTASNLKVSRSNVLKDFVAVSGAMSVSHLFMFTKSDAAVNLRLICTPRGPTFTFQIQNYVLSRDIISMQKRPVSFETQLLHHPLLVLNNFAASNKLDHVKLTQAAFQNVFASINVNTVKLKDIRRCALLNYDPSDESIDFRHYSIVFAPSGISRSAKKLMQSKVPKMGRYDDVSEYFLNPGQLSESEYEIDGAAGENSVDTSTQPITSRGCRQADKCAIRLVEIGPRMKLKLIKIEQGICDGETLFHAYVKKSKQEIEEIGKRIAERKKLKLLRQKQQAANVEKKRELKEQLKEKSLEGMKRKMDADNADASKNKMEQVVMKRMRLSAT